MGTQGLVHDVHRHVITVRQVPQQVQHLVGHHAVLVVLRQAPDQLQKLLALLFARVGPACLQEVQNERRTVSNDKG